MKDIEPKKVVTSAQEHLDTGITTVLGAGQDITKGKEAEYARLHKLLTQLSVVNGNAPIQISVNDDGTSEVQVG